MQIGVIAAALSAAPLAAQRIASFPRPEPHDRQLQSWTTPAADWPALDSARIRRTYWLEGGLVLGGFGLLAGLTATEFCNHKFSCEIGLGTLAGALLFTVGSLIGGQIPK